MKLIINNETVNDSRTIANKLNNFFVSIGPVLADTITCSKDSMSYVANNYTIEYKGCHLPTNKIECNNSPSLHTQIMQ